jgi:hypothetical protein
MKVFAALVALGAVGITSASAQVLLSGQYHCVQNCSGPGLAYVTQNGWDLNLVNEVGQPSRAWIDYPGHIWVQYWNEGANYSPDGMTIQFDRGSVWQRITPDMVAYCARRFKSYDPTTGTYLGYDRLRHSCP